MHAVMPKRASSSPWIEERGGPGRRIQFSRHTAQFSVGVHSHFAKQLEWQPLEKGLKLHLLSRKGLPSPVLSIEEKKENRVCERA